MKTTAQIVEELSVYNLEGWGNCGLWTENGKYNGYLYPITHREGGYMDTCLGIETVAAILSICNKYVIREDGYIDIW